jgi:hypothetical protein
VPELRRRGDLLARALLLDALHERLVDRVRRFVKHDLDGEVALNPPLDGRDRRVARRP